MPTSGREAVQVTYKGGYGGFESADGKFSITSRATSCRESGVCPRAEAKKPVLPSLEAGFLGEPPGISFYSFKTQRPTRIFDLESRPVLFIPGLAVSPGGKTILYTQLGAFSRDIVLVENYR